ncbi:hypothetical protein V2S66_13490 [Streptomyces sp. V4-01]|uniref:Tat pathway signal sequence domain protein n=1 Tax=Actinacidiphila polyblastidii TaxID=3110430 RepID=A0ABU7PAY4_9ACTN|nr:hypothetical protein [Streptomyces sp. V4-01]
MGFRRRNVVASAAALLAAGAAAALVLTARGPSPHAPTAAELTALPACSRADVGRDSLQVSMRGLPRNIGPGDGWHELTASMTNVSGRRLPVAFVSAYPTRQTLGDGDPPLGPYSSLEVRTPGADGWRPAPALAPPIAVVRGLRPGARIAYRMRFRLNADAPRGLDYGDVMLDVHFADVGPGVSGRTRPCRQESVGDAPFEVHPSATGPAVTPSGG